MIVDVCTANSYHCELTVAALNAGKHVICEKPLAPTASEIEKMIEARDRSGKKLMCAQHFRFGDGSNSQKIRPNRLDQSTTQDHGCCEEMHCQRDGF